MRCTPFGRSWREMFVMQPPVTAMDMYMMAHRDTRSSWDQNDDSGDGDNDGKRPPSHFAILADAYSPSGLTLGDLQDLVDKCYQQAMAYRGVWGMEMRFSLTMTGFRTDSGVSLSNIIESCHKQGSKDGLCDCLKAMLGQEDVDAEKSSD